MNYAGDRRIDFCSVGNNTGRERERERDQKNRIAVCVPEVLCPLVKVR